MFIKFLVYSDIHYDRLGARCVTTEDCIKVETDIINRAFETNCQFVLFCGDRFLRREPEDEVKTKADQVLYDAYNNGLMKECPHFRLIGNHDWTKNSRKWHTSNSLSRIKNICIMDTSMSYMVNVFGSDYANLDNLPVLLHALPAGHKFDLSNYNFYEGRLNLFVFHDMVSGSYLDDDGKIIAKYGIPREEIDISKWDFVFAGDIHIPQMLPFKNTQGGYIGSVIQRTMADANKPRGWLEVEANYTINGWVLETNFVPTRNFFTKISFNLDNTSNFSGLDIDKSLIDDQFVKIELIGEKKDVDRIASNEKWNNFKTFLNVRDLEIFRNYQTQQSEIIVDMSNSVSLIDDLTAYLNSDFVDVGNLSKDKIIGVANKIIGE